MGTVSCTACGFVWADPEDGLIGAPCFCTLAAATTASTVLDAACDLLDALADLIEAGLEALAAAANLALTVASLDLSLLEHALEEPHPHWT